MNLAVDNPIEMIQDNHPVTSECPNNFVHRAANSILPPATVAIKVKATIPTIGKVNPHLITR